MPIIPHKLSHFPPQASAVVILILSSATILSALGFQHIGGYIPCALCLEQREPYYITILIMSLATIFSMIVKSMGLIVWRALFVLVAVVMAYGAGLGIYHVGIEWSFWEGPASCSQGAGFETLKVDQLSQALETQKIVPCGEITWQFLGLSFAGWNVVLSVFLACFAGVSALNIHQRVRRKSRCKSKCSD